MNKILVILTATIAAIAMIYCDTSHSRDYTQPYIPQVVGPAPSGVDPGISMREFGALYILQQQQALDMQRQQLQLMQQQQQQYNNQLRMQQMQNTFPDFR